ncbi:hypothetical protein [Bacillus methanolicus]|uniref:hypothetical protein n=1 Tax=Bacillus methanolicus TaxID=1471 RepID=UPI0032C48237
MVVVLSLSLFFAIWDAYSDAKGKKASLTFLPFVFSAYLVTVKIIYLATFKVNGMLLGPIWLPMLSLLIRILIGILLRYMLFRFIRCRGNLASLAQRNASAFITNKRQGNPLAFIFLNYPASLAQQGKNDPPC